MSEQEGSVREPTSSDWFKASLTRRKANQIGLGAVAVAGIAGTIGCSDGSKQVEMDALDAQKKGGWNVGDDKLPLAFQNTSATDIDGGSYDEYKVAKNLLAVTQASEKWRKWEMPTLVQALEQPTLAAQMKGVASRLMQENHAQARGLASLISATENPASTMLILDMPGPQSVAAAAGMSDSVEPVFFFDDWPHPKGVVPSHQTLGALLFTAAELKRNKANRPKEAPVAFVLDDKRLSPYSSPTTQFDNRYAANLPSAEDLKKNGIKSIMYVTATEKSQELDDLNDIAVEYDKAGLKMEMIALSAFQKDPEYQPDPDPANRDPSDGYYYGGSRRYHTHFFVYYPMYVYRPRYGYMAPSRSMAPSRIRRPSYRAAPRKTAFSGRRAGGAGGVGRRKMSGFGRVSTRTSKSGRIMGTRSGSSGRFRSSSGGG